MARPAGRGAVQRADPPGGRAALRAAGEAVRPHLPVEAAATEVALMAGPVPGNPETPPGQWRLRASFPLGKTRLAAGR